MPWRQIQDSHGIWHRQIAVLMLDQCFVDTEAVRHELYTGCGIWPAPEDLRRTRDDAACLTCVICSSGVPGEGDLFRMEQKHRLFGIMYGAHI